MAVAQTEADFEQMSWHDCHIWRIEFKVGEPENDDWTSDLVLGLDFMEWLCGVDGRATLPIISERQRLSLKERNRRTTG